MYYYEILPLKKTGPEARTFTYQSEAKLNIGSLVQVPLKNRSVRGLVFSPIETPEYKTREITKILSEEEILTESQIEIAGKIAEYYLCSLGETVNAFLPFDFGKKRHTQKIQNKKLKTPSNSQIIPNQEQKKIIESIASSKPGTTHLLHGVTGSGKTEVYLRLVEKALKDGKGSIILVPEIALTPQTFARFEERFGKQVAIWHSDLKETEKHHTWQEIRSGQKKIVLGARSAILMPVMDPAYIIIDEEHESSYKQDQNPRYDARQIAEWLADQGGTKLILGSATPRIESFYRAQNNQIAYHWMKKRIVQESMPPVSIVDLRDEFRKGNKSIISDNLQEAISDTLGAQKQVMLLLNRRGAATFVVCRDCGQVESCPRCEIPLTYHPSEGQILKCHHCSYRKNVPTSCPSCQSMAIKYFGLGTQRAELEIQKLFPEAKIVRMDHDTTQKRAAHQDIFHDFKNEKFDILIGTQMIAKGWDLPNVELVGVISADTMVNLPDFRSAERTFSLLTQVAGRTGRGYHPGKVIVQTYSPDNYAIVAASKHDYIRFYDQEVKSRQKYNYPPYSSLIKLVYSHTDQAKAENAAKIMQEALNATPQPDLTAEKISTKRSLDDARDDKGTDIQILGPSPCFIEKLAGKYRYQLILKLAANRKQRAAKGDKLDTRYSIIDTKVIVMDNTKPGWQIDVDPESLL